MIVKWTSSVIGWRGGFTCIWHWFAIKMDGDDEEEGSISSNADGVQVKLGFGLPAQAHAERKSCDGAH